MTNKKRYFYPGLLFLTATIWGLAFVAQSVGMDYVGPFTFTAARSIIGGLVLLPVIALMTRRQETTPSASDGPKSLIVAGLACGTALFCASILQQIGIMYTSVGKAGFLTTFYVAVVPVFAIFRGRKVHPLIWPMVVVALIGLYLMTMSETMTLEKGDALVLASSFVFALHISLIDHYIDRVDGVQLSCAQFFVCGAWALVFMVLLETPSWPSLLAAWAPILYAGVMSNGVAYTLQIIGQKGVHPTVASLILSLESAVAVLGGWLILGQVLSARELAGCALLFTAIIAAQVLPQKASKPEEASTSS